MKNFPGMTDGSTPENPDLWAAFDEFISASDVRVSRLEQFIYAPVGTDGLVSPGSSIGGTPPDLIWIDEDVPMPTNWDDSRLTDDKGEAIWAEMPNEPTSPPDNPSD